MSLEEDKEELELALNRHKLFSERLTKAKNKFSYYKQRVPVLEDRVNRLEKKIRTLRFNIKQKKHNGKVE